MQSEAGKGVILANGVDVHLAVAVKVVPFPEDIVAVWVMIAARFREESQRSISGEEVD